MLTIRLAPCVSPSGRHERPARRGRALAAQTRQAGSTATATLPEPEPSHEPHSEADSGRSYVDASTEQDVHEADVIVIGGGIGGLCCASLLAKYGVDVAVVEAHSVPGGCAHHWDRRGFNFDSGAALFSGLTPRPDGSVSANPLQSVLQAIGETLDVVDLDDSATCLMYPDGEQYRTQLGSPGFVEVVRARWGHEAAAQWDAFQTHVQGLQSTAGAVQPLAVRFDNGVGLTAAARRPLDFLRFLVGGAAIHGKSFEDIVNEAGVSSPAVRRLIDLVTMGTCSVPPSDIDATYMVRAFNEMWSPSTLLQYPRGGSSAIVETLVRGLKRLGGHLVLRAPVDTIQLAPDGLTSTGVQLLRGRVIRARRAVVSNASVWDTARLLHGAARPQFAEYCSSLHMNDSMMHLHVGFRAKPGEDLPMHTYFLESEHSGDNGWPTIVIPSTLDPSLAPPGHHALHATITESFAPWAHLKRSSPEYNALKKERALILWGLVTRLIPDISERCVTSWVGTPKSHARFLRRAQGAYGPRNLLTMVGTMPQAVKPLANMYCCGDTTFPGVGVPAVAASGMWVANSLVPVPDHWHLLDAVGI